MPGYRITVRYGAPRALYEVLDLDASDLRAAMRAAADRLTDEIVATAELAEVRTMRGPDAREFVPG